MIVQRVRHVAPPGYAAQIREDLRPLIGVYPAGFGLVGTDGVPLTVGSGITVVPGRDGVALDTTSSNTGITRSVSVTDHPLTLVFGARWDSSANTYIASIATAADKTCRLFNSTGAYTAQHIGATTNASANTGAVVSDGYYGIGVAVFASPTDLRVYGRGNAGQGRGASTTNVGALGTLDKAAFGTYDGSVKINAMDGQIQFAQWLRVALTDAEAWALVDNPWSMFRPRSIWVPVSAGGGGTSIGAGVGSAAAAGHASSIVLRTPVLAGVGAAAATGHQAALVMPTVVAAGAGAAAAAGLTATVVLSTPILAGAGAAAAAGHATEITTGTTIQAGVGSATAAGHAATVTLTTSIACGVGAAQATGAAAVIQAGNIVVQAGVGSAVAAGHGAVIALSTVINAGTGAATAAGSQAQIGLGALISAGTGAASAAGSAATVALTTRISGGVANATAAGLAAEITLTTPTLISCGIGAATARGHTASIVGSGDFISGNNDVWLVPHRSTVAHVDNRRRRG